MQKNSMSSRVVIVDIGYSMLLVEHEAIDPGPLGIGFRSA